VIYSLFRHTQFVVEAMLRARRREPVLSTEENYSRAYIRKSETGRCALAQRKRRSTARVEDAAIRSGQGSTIVCKSDATS